jgi:hypothetical protein
LLTPRPSDGISEFMLIDVSLRVSPHALARARLEKRKRRLASELLPPFPPRGKSVAYAVRRCHCRRPHTIRNAVNVANPDLERPTAERAPPMFSKNVGGQPGARKAERSIYAPVELLL